MAAPGVGGTALLIRQYFMDLHSKFWSKSCRQDYTFCSMGFPAGPSGVLLKATLLHSGSPMQTFQGTGGSISLTSPPDMFQVCLLWLKCDYSRSVGFDLSIEYLFDDANPGLWTR